MRLLLHVGHFLFPPRFTDQDIKRFEQEAQEEIDRKYPLLAKYRRQRREEGI